MKKTRVGMFYAANLIAVLGLVLLCTSIPTRGQPAPSQAFFVGIILVAGGLVVMVAISGRTLLEYFDRVESVEPPVTDTAPVDQ